MRSIGWLLLIVSLALVAAGCGGDDDDGSQTQAETGAASTSELTVYAATSLTEVFPAIDPAPEYSFAGSDELATQIREGARHLRLQPAGCGRPYRQSCWNRLDRGRDRAGDEARRRRGRRSRG